MKVAGLVIAGFVFSALFCIGWAASMMTARDWCYLLGLSAVFTLAIYGRGWLRALMGLSKRGMRNAERGVGSQPKFLKLHHTRPPTNGHAPHPKRDTLHEPRTWNL